MGTVYKVTSASIGETKRGYKIFKIHLNNSFFATKLFPLRSIDLRHDKLYQLYIENDKSLDFLVDKYIAIILGDSKYGVEFSSIISFNAFQDFKDLLDRSKGKAFTTRIDMYDFLKRKKYSINPDDSITLKNNYKNYNIKDLGGLIICYPNNLGEDHLNLDNIKIIFNHFYNGKFIDDHNPDRISKYALTSSAIIKNRKIYHKSRSKTLSNDDFDVLRIGENLSKEQLEYILKNK